MTVSVKDQKSFRHFSLVNVLNRPELILIATLIGSVLLCLILSAVKSQPIAWPGFVLSLLPTLGLLLAGIYIRLFKNQPKIAQLAIANSLFLGFMGISALLIYLRFPIGTLSLDQRLIEIDGLVGYTWPGIVETVASYPPVAYALRYVYHSSLPQLFVMIGFLALTGRSAALNRAMLAGSFGLLLTTFIWWLAPSVGPSVFYTLPDGLEDRIGLVTNSTYSGILRDLAANGLAIIAPDDIVGTIAFPSFHTVMLLLVVWYLRGTVLFLPALFLNIAMVPAILSHGGHHLTDVFGGIAVFAAAAWLAAQPWMHRAAKT